MPLSMSILSDNYVSESYNVVKKKDPISAIYESESKANRAQYLDTRHMYLEFLSNINSAVISPERQNYLVSLKESYQSTKRLSDEELRSKLESEFRSIYENDFLYEMNLEFAYNEIRMDRYVSQIKRENLIREAVILAKDIPHKEKIHEISILNETIRDKLGAAFTNAIETIKKLFAKFLEKLRANFTTTKHYMEKYKDCITKQTWVARNYRTYGKIIDNITPLLQFEVPGLNYTSMKNNLKDPVTFAKTSFSSIPSMSKLKDDATANDIASTVKDYFIGEEGVEIPSIKFQNEIAKIYDFLYDIRKIEQSIKKSIDQIENDCKKALKVAGIDINQTKNESTYSYLFGHVLFEAEAVDTAQTAKDTQNAEDPNRGGLNHTKNISDAGEDEVGTKESQKTEVEGHLKVYSDVCIACLRAKLTAVELFRSELFQIVRFHVKDYHKDETNELRNPENSEESSSNK